MSKWLTRMGLQVFLIAALLVPSSVVLAASPVTNPALVASMTLGGVDVLPPNAIGITPLTVSPTNASLITYIIAFDEAVQNFDDASDLVISHTGTANATVGISGGGNAYSVSIGGITGDGTFTVEVSASSDVQDLAGNPLASSVSSSPMEIDNTPPDFIGLVATPNLADYGTLVTIDFDSSEPLDGAPTVTVNTNAATQASKAVSYSYEYTIQLTDPLGSAAIEISGFDLAGNFGLVNDTATLEVGVPDPEGEEEGLPVAAWPVAVALGVVAMARLRRHT